MTILNEILNAPSTEEDEFSAEWQAVFGEGRSSVALSTNQNAESSQHSEFLPSNLLDLNKQMSGMSLTSGAYNFFWFQIWPEPLFETLVHKTRIENVN